MSQAASYREQDLSLFEGDLEGAFRVGGGQGDPVISGVDENRNYHCKPGFQLKS